MTAPKRPPARWAGSESALRAVQVAFDVEQAVLENIRIAAFHDNVSTSTQIRHVLGLPVAARPKRPRLTVTLDEADYTLLAARYGLAPDDRLGIKEAATRELIAFHPPAPRAAAAKKAPRSNTTRLTGPPRGRFLSRGDPATKKRST